MNTTTPNRRICSVVVMILAAIGLSSQAIADFTPVSFDYNVSNQTRNTGYPMGYVELGNVLIDSIPGGSVPFDIPSSGPNEWTGPARHHMASSDDTGWYTLDIPVHLTGVRTVCTLINQHWWSGSTTVEFLDTNGFARYSRVFRANTDIRDYNAGTGGTIHPLYAQGVIWLPEGSYNSPDVMDLQTTEMPEYFWDNGGNELATIRVYDYSEWMSHQVIISGVTVSDQLVQVPEPATLILLMLGSVALGVRRQTR